MAVGLERGWEHDQENNMNGTTHNIVPAPADSLHAELRSLIASSRQRLAGAVNAELIRLYWSVGISWRKSLAVGLKPKTSAAWCSLPRHSRCQRLSQHCHDN